MPAGRSTTTWATAKPDRCFARTSSNSVEGGSSSGEAASSSAERPIRGRSTPLLPRWLAAHAPLLRGHALDDHLDVLWGGTARLRESSGQALDDLWDRLLGDAGVVRLAVDPGHLITPSSAGRGGRR